ncbi:MAG: urea amidolyase [Rhodobacteraceae bacterium]|nr:urea amidolyase [Paracoccaceae bacterium]
MTGKLIIERSSPGLSLQDGGREGVLALGLSRGGAMDRPALAEAAALFAQRATPALEMAVAGGAFRAVGGAVRIALTGAEMVADINGKRIPWWALHVLQDGDVLNIGAALGSVYGYLSVAGGFEADLVYGSASARVDWGIGRKLGDGDTLSPVAACDLSPRCLTRPVDRKLHGPVRILAGPQTRLFSDDSRTSFFDASYRHSGRGNRVGIALGDGPELIAPGQLSLVSDVVVPGDIQAVGSGAPYVLLADCQTTGGYPRIGTVISADLVRVAQMAPGAEIQFLQVSREEALSARKAIEAELAALSDGIQPLIRDPRDAAELLTHNLISGAVAGDEGDH